VKAANHPIVVIRRIKKHGGHHGGAWKVAYADFVTAMMAFFLVMWLAAQDSRIRDAVAGYFQQPGLMPHERSNSVIASGQGGIDSSGMPTVVQKKPDGMLEAEQRALVAAADHIKEQMLKTPEFSSLRDQVEFSVTSEGLRVELTDHPGSSFFNTGSSVLLGETVSILQLIATEIGKLRNDVVIEGHTDSQPFVAGGPTTNWELSADRANAARRVMVTSGLRDGQLRAVRGFADQDLRIKDNPADARNRRVSIVVRSLSAAEIETVLRSTKAPAR
jgi:chemotaxis protein MotB